MLRPFSKYLSWSNYQHRWKRIQRQGKVSRLGMRKSSGTDFRVLWEVSPAENPGLAQNPGALEVSAMGVSAGRNIHWMRDVPGSFNFPVMRMDKYKMSSYFNRGFDVKYPWELSRFSFGKVLALEYLQSKNRNYYNRFRELVTDWIRKNPFLHGVNWVCTMEVAIRATNWILAANAFATELKRDTEFMDLFSHSLEQHARFIYTFPEVYKNKHSTNHTSSDYLGLLYLDRALPDHPEAGLWQKMAVQGLQDCIKYQTYSDGGSFEASLAYHRLVTELFALGAILCLEQKIHLPDFYFSRLQSMFGFLLSNCSPKGYPAQYGDNDSGTLLQTDYAENHNYAYMTALQKQIFIPGIPGSASGDKPPFLALLPAEPAKYPISDEIRMLKKQEIKVYPESGIAAFRMDTYSGSIHFIPIGQNGHGGHNHLDVGSFVLFHDGDPVIVDPGSYTYTRDFRLRNQYRSYFAHNTVIPEAYHENKLEQSRLFALEPYYRDPELTEPDEESIELSYTLISQPARITRRFRFSKGILQAEDSTIGKFQSRLHFAPEIKIIDARPGTIRTRLFTIRFDPGLAHQIEEYKYSRAYQHQQDAFRLVIFAESSMNMRIEFTES